MLFKDFVCTVTFATLASTAVAKQVPSTNWDKYAGERHHDSHQDSHHGVHTREAEAEPEAYNPSWHHAQGVHGGVKISNSRTLVHPPISHAPTAPHHARDAEPEAATKTRVHPSHTHPTGNAGSWTKPSDWASWWSSDPHPTGVQHGGQHNARNAEPEAEPGVVENTWNELKKKISNGKPNNFDNNKPFNNDFHKVHARNAIPDFRSGGAHDYDINADWHKKLLAEHGVKYHARDIEDFSSDEYDFSEEGYGEALQARDVEEEDYTSPEFLDKLYARNAPAEGSDEEVADNETVSAEFLEKLYARDVVDEGEEHTAEEAEAAYHEYLQTRGLDASHLTGPQEEGEDYDSEEAGDLSARDVEDIYIPNHDDDSEEDGSNLAARDARNAFFAGEGAHPTVNNARINGEAHRRLLAAKGIKLNARDVEGDEPEADEEFAEPAAPPAEDAEEPEIEARGLPTGLPKNVPTVSFKRPSRPTQTGRSGFGNLFGKAW